MVRRWNKKKCRFESNEVVFNSCESCRFCDGHAKARWSRTVVLCNCLYRETVYQVLIINCRDWKEKEGSMGKIQIIQNMIASRENDINAKKELIENLLLDIKYLENEIEELKLQIGGADG